MMPEMFHIFSVPVSGYQFFYLLGILIGSGMILYLSRKEKLDTVEVAAFLFLFIFCAILGAKLLGALLLQLSRSPAARPGPKVFWEYFSSGGVFFGGIAGALLFALNYSRLFFKKEHRKLWDITVIGAALGHAIGRLGCLCAGCCYGIPTSLPWGVVFTRLGRSPHPLAGIPLHPVQLYEAGLCFANFVFLILLWRKRRFPGQIFSFYLINYGLIRFFLEFLRHHDPGEMLWNGGISWYQGFSLFLVLVGWVFRRRFQ
jgi:phosphatidylglycerol---prolipoprotein diacylglyceryl transferase